MSGGSAIFNSRRRNAWQKISYACPCGRTIYGNGKAHQRNCETHLRELGWLLDDGMRDALREAHPDGAVAVIAAVERGIGQVYLERRARGDKTGLRWSELRDLVWRLADTIAPNLRLDARLTGRSGQ